MRFGVFSMPEHYPWDQQTLSFQRDIDEMVLAEKLGFDEYWIGEHHSGWYENVPVPEYMIAKASALTSRIQLATGVVNLPYHDPFQVAERLAFLDQLTYGRLIYGFGAGGLPTDWALHNMDGDIMRPRMQESLGIIKRLTEAREPISYDGRFWQGQDREIQVRPYKNRIPEFGLAGLTGSSSFAIAAQNGWGALSVHFTPPKFTNNPNFIDLEGHAAVLVEQATAAGLDPIETRRRWRVVREVFVAEDRESAVRQIRAGVKSSYDYLISLGLGPLMKLDEAMDDSDLTLDWMIDNGWWLVGSPDDVNARVKELYDRLGGFGTLILNSRDWGPTDQMGRSFELFARFCIPALEGLEVGRPTLPTMVERQAVQAAALAAAEAAAQTASV
jgi:limonene 1,2-monooxygenase